MRKKIVGIRPMTRAQIRTFVTARIAKGIQSAAPFMRDMLKRTVGVQAPRKRAPKAVCGWLAITAASPGAPPRRVSGCGQRGIYFKKTKNGVSFRSRRRYMMILERKNHPWLQKTINQYKREFFRIIGRSVNERKYGYNYA